MLVPAALAFAQFPGWWQLVATLGLFLGLDVLVAYVVEPIVIGAKTGVSSMAMLVSAIFWSWLWGPVGLVLSTPLTVCLAVLGKHVPRLSSLAVLLDDQPALEDQLVLYHRLLSGDEEEAEEILDRRFGEKTPAQVFDEIIIPALLLADRDRARGEISEADHQHVVRTIRALAETAPVTARDRQAPAVLAEDAKIQRIVGVSARTVTDETIWEMLAQLVEGEKVQLESVGSSYLASETTAAIVDGPLDGVAGYRLCHLGSAGRTGPGALHLPAPAREAAGHAHPGHPSGCAGAKGRKLPETDGGRRRAGLLHAGRGAHQRRAATVGPSLMGAHRRLTATPS